MSFGFYTGLGFNMGMPYFGGMSGFCGFYPMYNPFALLNFTPNWYTINNHAFNNQIPMMSYNSSSPQFTAFSQSFTPLFTPNTANYPSFIQTYSTTTTPADFSASSIIKNGNSEQAEKPKDTQKNEQTVSKPFDGYNEEAGKRLAEIALKNTDRFHNQCSTHVNSDIAEANLGPCTDLDANKMFEQMRSNPKFKEIPASTDTETLKAGTVLIYDKGVSGYGDWGHIEIALGDGRAASDGITKKIKANPSALFIPISV